MLTGKKSSGKTECEESVHRSYSVMEECRVQLGEKLWNAVDMERVLALAPTLVDTREYTVERRLTGALSAGRLSARALPLSFTKGHTWERSLSGESFSQRFNLIRHQGTHRGEKPYQCADCEKRFSRSAYLVSTVFSTSSGGGLSSWMDPKKLFRRNGPDPSIFSLKFFLSPRAWRGFFFSPY